MKSFKNAFVEKIMRAIIRVGDYVAYDDQHVLKQRLINLGASDFFQVGLGIYYGVQKKVFEALWERLRGSHALADFHLIGQVNKDPKGKLDLLQVLELAGRDQTVQNTK